MLIPGKRTKSGRDRKKEHPVSAMIRRLIWLVLIVGIGWLYFQNLHLRAENMSLSLSLKQANVQLARLHRKPERVLSLRFTNPVEAAEQHLADANDAFALRDYAAALRDLDLAQAALGKAARGASQDTRSAARKIDERLLALRSQIDKVPGPWHKTPAPQSVSAVR